VLPRYGNVIDLSAFPRIAAWAGNMAALPHHDAVFASLAALGDFQVPNPPLLERLAPASKIGFKAIEDAAVSISKL
jgi:hypothetical protein